MLIWCAFQAAVLNICHSCCHEGKRFWKVCFRENANSALARSHWSIQGRALHTSGMVPSASWEGFTGGGGWPWKDDLSGLLERSESRRPGRQQSRAALESCEPSKAPVQASDWTSPDGPISELLFLAGPEGSLGKSKRNKRPQVEKARQGVF